jgi:hypothetical protein
MQSRSELQDCGGVPLQRSVFPVQLGKITVARVQMQDLGQSAWWYSADIVGASSFSRAAEERQSSEQEASKVSVSGEGPEAQQKQQNIEEQDSSG